LPLAKYKKLIDLRSGVEPGLGGAFAEKQPRVAEGS
jgi:hypothetical protein